MEHNLLGSPLEALHAAYLDLTTKIEANVISLDEAILQIQDKEVVDAAGHTWRIDPVTQSFIRRAPGPDGQWKPADPSEYAFTAPQGPADPRDQPFAATGGQPVIPDAPAVQPAPPGPPGPPGPGGGPGTPPGGLDTLLGPRGLPAARDLGKGGRKPRWPKYAIAGAAGTAIVVVAVVIVAVTVSGSSPTPKDSTAPAGKKGGAASSAPAKPTPGPVLAKGYPVPSATSYTSAVTEVTSGDLSRISSVVEKSQYSPVGQRLYAATFAGWVNYGFTVKPGQPMGDASGLTATQVWELRDEDEVLAAATVDWHRATRTSPWRLARWPQFRMAG
ncbi:hypothetical protein ACRYCC_13320 [Actinomadura scrupuli]|uniref:hypothetical protein n=1 Tax=Actinomadura scrupuli TaxID=559629 RepID=UPI003D97385D